MIRGDSEILFSPGSLHRSTPLCGTVMILQTHSELIMNITRMGNHTKHCSGPNDSLIIVMDLANWLRISAMTIRYDTGRSTGDLKECVTKRFALSSKLAGDILQKYVNYGIKLAIIGIFPCHKIVKLSSPWFIMKAIKGRISFCPDVEEAIKNGKWHGIVRR